MTKRALLISGIVFGSLLFFAGGFVILRALLFFLMPGKRPSIPDELKVASVLFGKDAISRTPYYSDADLGVITDIQPKSDHSVVIVGTRGAALLGEHRQPIRTVHFANCPSEVVSTDLGNGGFLCRGAWASDAVLFDHDGKTVWSYSGQDGIDDAVPADFRSTAGGVVVGLNGGGGIRFLDSEGKEVWKQDDGNVWHVEVASRDGNSERVIVHSNARGQLTLRDASGNVLSRYKPEVYLAQFALTAWDDDPNRNKLIAPATNFVYILAMDGTTVARLSAPFTAGTDTVKGTTVRFAGKPPYYAALVPHKLWQRSVLYIYNERALPIYGEVLDHNCSSLQAVASENGSEELLLGCDGAVWNVKP